MRFALACRAARRLLSLRLMRFLRFAVIPGAAALILICSCEKHHVGEMPEAQKEHAESSGQEAPGDAGMKSPEHTSSMATPTPAEFFPKKKQ